MKECNICPRKCNTDRENGKHGVCMASGDKINIARSALHMWEEPCISGARGSGTVFFCGCNLRCVYCQNYNISRRESGYDVTISELVDCFLNLQSQGANNINLVTPTHYAYKIREALLLAKEKGLNIPIVYNSSGYESVDTLKDIEDVIDIYLVDFKYINKETALRYSKAEDYPEIVKNAVEAMVRARSKCEFDERGIMQKGVIVRHLLLPSHVKEGKEIIKYLSDKYGNRIFISLMNQYTPVSDLAEYPEINRKVTKREYDRLVDYALELGLENVYIQEGDTAKESFIPDFCVGNPLES